MTEGERRAANKKAQIRLRGQEMLVTRRANIGGGTPTTQPIFFLPQPLNLSYASPQIQEAVLNAGEDNPYDFVCAGDEDISETLDEITYNGQIWGILNTNPQVVSGTQITIHCIGARRRSA